MEDAAGAEARADGEGATLGEAKWAALKQLERRFAGITADAVNFEVVEEGDEEAGEPAKVAAEVDLDAWEEQDDELPDEPAERVRAVVSRVVLALDLRASVDIDEDEEEIRATVNGEDLGLLIGRHGQTIDALQHIVSRAAYPEHGDRKRVVVDAAGYRARRETALHRSADRAVSDALSFGRPVELEPMSAFERRTVHTYLKDNPEVDTHSEGDEPDRRLVVTPVRAE
jgi:spoIIIJ-associated protein